MDALGGSVFIFNQWRFYDLKFVSITMNLKKISTLYVAFSKKEFTQRVAEDKRRAVNRLYSAYASEGQNLKTLQPLECEKLLAVACADLNPTTYNNVRKNLSAMWDWCASMKLTSAPNPFAAIPRKKTTRIHSYAPPSNDVFKVFSIATEEEQLIMLFSMLANSSKAEMRRFRFADIDHKRSKVGIRTLKNGEHNEIVEQVDVPAFLVKLLKDYGITSKHYNELFNGHPLITEDRNKSLNRLCNAAKVKPFTIEALRTLKARIAISKDGCLLAIQKHLRHANLKTTKSYVRDKQEASTHLRNSDFDFLIEGCLLTHILGSGKNMDVYFTAKNQNGDTPSYLMILCDSLFYLIEKQTSEKQHAAIRQQLLQFIVAKFATSCIPIKKLN